MCPWPAGNCGAKCGGWPCEVLLLSSRFGVDGLSHRLRNVHARHSPRSAVILFQYTTTSAQANSPPFQMPQLHKANSPPPTINTFHKRSAMCENRQACHFHKNSHLKTCENLKSYSGTGCGTRGWDRTASVLLAQFVECWWYKMNAVATGKCCCYFFPVAFSCYNVRDIGSFDIGSSAGQEFKG